MGDTPEAQESVDSKQGAHSLGQSYSFRLHPFVYYLGGLLSLEQACFFSSGISWTDMWKPPA